MRVKVRATGAAAARVALQRIEKGQRKAVDAALKKGAGVTAKEMRRRAPKGELTAARMREGEAKRLKRRIKVTTPKRLRKGEVGAALAKAAAPHAHLVEKGTKQRQREKGGATGRMTAAPFAAPAAEATRSRVVEVVVEEFKKRLEADARKAAARAARRAGG